MTGAARSVGLVVNVRRRRAIELAHEATDWLVARGHLVRIPDDDAAVAGLEKYGCPTEQFASGIDLAVSLGGDGTILRTVGLVASSRVPVLGVCLGRLGYLSHVEPDSLTSAFERFLDGDFDLDERLMLRVAVVPGPPDADRGETGESDTDDQTIPADRRAAGRDARVAPAGATSHLALNEAVVEKPSAGQVVRVAVSADGTFFTSYAADGMIVATPTGSTAYAFSARGPIIAPAHRAFLLTPVSPHMAFDRSLVFDPSQSLRLEVLDRPARLIVDGHELGSLAPGAAITCTAADETARFVTFGPPDFYGVLKAKFGLADR
ncbi:MAG: NAD(+)/NADH kinase [Acidimicrobiales bacterium]